MCIDQPEQKNTLELTNYAILIHQYHHDLHRAAVILEQALYGEPTCIEALIAYGNVLFEMAEAVQKDPRKKGERNMMYDRAIKWGNRKAEHPNCYDFLTKLQHKVLLSSSSSHFLRLLTLMYEADLVIANAFLKIC